MNLNMNERELVDPTELGTVSQGGGSYVSHIEIDSKTRSLDSAQSDALDSDNGEHRDRSGEGVLEKPEFRV